MSNLSDVELGAAIKDIQARLSRLEDILSSNRRSGSALTVTTPVNHNEQAGSLGDVLEHTDVTANNLTHKHGKLATKVGADRQSGDEHWCVDAKGEVGIDHRVVVQDSTGKWICVSGHVA